MFKRKGYRFSGPQDSLDKIANDNATTPMAVYEVIRQYEMQPEPVPLTGMTLEEVEDRFAGTGLGRKTLVEVCDKVDLAVTSCMERLVTKGYQVGAQDKLKEVAERYEINPIDILKMLLVKDFKPVN